MISIYDWFGYELSIKERYRLIKEAGFDGVLLWWSEGFGRGDYRSGPEIAQQQGLVIENIHAPVENQNNLWLDNLDGEALMCSYLQCIEDCAKFGFPTMVVHLPDEKHPLSPLGLDRMKRIAEKAEQVEVNVALENLWNLTNLTDVLEQIKSSRLGFCYDCCHHFNYYPDKDLLSMYGTRLMAIHLHDNGGRRKQHQLPFDGKIDWTAAMKNIAEAGYHGPTSIEAMNWDYENLEVKEFLDRAFERAKRLEALRACTQE